MLSIVAVTLWFGMRPFNLIPRNDLRIDPENGLLLLHPSSFDQTSSKRRGIARSDSPIIVPEHDELRVTLRIIPRRIPAGLGSILTFYDPIHKRPSFVVAQWIDHLVVRAADEPSGPHYREIGAKQTLLTDKEAQLEIISGPQGVRVLLNGKQIRQNRALRLLDPTVANEGILLVGNDATGRESWIGSLRELSIAITQDGIKQPLARYAFSSASSLDTTPNSANPRCNLSHPPRFNPPARITLRSPWEVDFTKPHDRADVLINIFGFIPASLVFISLIQSRLPTQSLAFAASVLATFAFSLLIELTQAFLPTRDSSSMDLICNTLGCLLAYGLAGLWKIARRPQRPASLGQ